MLPAENPWLVCLCPNPDAGVRLCCFPYAGGGVPAFRDWPAALAAVAEVWVVCYPGRGARFHEPAFRRLGPLVDALLPRLMSALRPPFAFFGHSLGALIAFEVARAMRLRGAGQPIHLLLSACRAPHLPLASEPIYDLPDREFIDALRRYNGTPAGLLADQELRELLLPVLRADFAVAESYIHVHGDPLACPITVLGGRDDIYCPAADLLAWQLHTAAVFDLCYFPGDHFYLHSAGAEVLATIGQVLSGIAAR